MAVVDILFMSIPAIQDQPGKCFEEVRIEDYLNAYRSTGRPPVPVPQEPTGEQQRTLLGLAPLFKPYSTRDTGPAAAANEALTPASPSTVVKPEDLPEAQEFLTTTSEGDVFQSISVMPMFRGFSPEELRLYAYLKGHKLPPPSVQMAPFANIPPLNPDTLPTEMVLNRPTTNASAPSTTETLLSITAQPGFTDHSFEELRVAYLQAGRELNSQEIFSVSAAPKSAPLPRTSLSIGGGGSASAFARPPPVRLF